MTAEMAAAYAKIKGGRNRRLVAVNLIPFGFVAPGMVNRAQEK